MLTGYESIFEDKCFFCKSIYLNKKIKNINICHDCCYKGFDTTLAATLEMSKNAWKKFCYPVNPTFTAWVLALATFTIACGIWYYVLRYLL